MAVIVREFSPLRKIQVSLASVPLSYQYLFFALALYVASAIAVDASSFSTVFFAYSHFLLFLFPALFLIVLLICVLLDKQPGPFAKMRRLLKARGLRIVIMVAGFLFCVSAFTSLKVAIPDIVPFYADPFLSGLDAWLHGETPWRLAHAIWPSGWSNFLLICYETIWQALWLATPFFVAMAVTDEMQKRYFWSFFLCLVTNGTVLAMVLSSVGPIFYYDFFDGDHHVGLKKQLSSAFVGTDPLFYPNYLLTSFKNDTAAFGSGISAMPSVHVTIAVLNAYLFSTVNKRFGFLMWLFAAAILFGSVYTGWHYALDGYVSFVVVTIIWFVVKHMHTDKYTDGAELKN